MDHIDAMDDEHPLEDGPVLPDRLELVTKMSNRLRTQLLLIEDCVFVDENDLCEFDEQEDTRIFCITGAPEYVPQFDTKGLSTADGALRVWDACPPPEHFSTKVWDQQTFIRKNQKVPKRALGALTGYMQKYKRGPMKGAVLFDIEEFFTDEMVPVEAMERWVIEQLKARRHQFHLDMLRVFVDTQSDEDIRFFESMKFEMQGFYDNLGSYAMIWHPKDVEVVRS